jgi:hypothetical protein
MKLETQTVAVWSTPSGISAGDIFLNAESGTLEVGRLTYTPLTQDMTTCGWTLIGQAEVTVTLHDKAKIVDRQINILREEIKNVREQAELKVEQLSGQIQSLLALTCDSVVIEND